jgi:hypothetical protein
MIALLILVVVLALGGALVGILVAVSLTLVTTCFRRIGIPLLMGWGAVMVSIFAIAMYRWLR